MQTANAFRGGDQWSPAQPCGQHSITKRADYIIDLGPEGGSGGGTIVATGTPEEVAENPNSFTGQYLKPMLARAKELQKASK